MAKRFLNVGGSAVELGGGIDIRGLFDLFPHVVEERVTSSTDPTPAASTTVTSGASIHTKGSWAPLIASTTAAADMIAVIVWGTGLASNAGGALWDIRVNGVMRVENFAPANSTSASAVATVFLPINVPAGAFVEVRAQHARASVVASASYKLYRFPSVLGWVSPNTLDTFGAQTASTSGLSVGTTSNVKTLLSASAPHAYQGFIAMPLSNDTAMGGGNTTIDIGVGPDPSEVFLPGGTVWSTTSNEQYLITYPTGPIPGLSPISCAAGDRLVVRFRDSAQVTNTPNVVVLGVPYP